MATLVGRGGVWWIATLSYPQWAPCMLMQTFHWGEPVDSGSPLGCWAAVSTLPGHSPGWQAPMQARGVSQPSGCHRWCLSCAVVSFSPDCSDQVPPTLANPGHKAEKELLTLVETRPGPLWALKWLWPDWAELMAVHCTVVKKYTGGLCVCVFLLHNHATCCFGCIRSTSSPTTASQKLH